MIRLFLAALKHRLVDSDLAASIRYRIRYPGLTVAAGARITGAGDLAYGAGCSVSRRTRLILNPGSRLELGDRCRVDDDAELQPDNGIIRIGEESSIQKRCTLIGELAIGSYCLFAPNVFVSSGTHQFMLRPELLIRDQDDLACEQGAEDYNRRVTIEDDCWIGANAVILRGVTLGKGCIIGANSVVTRDVPPYAVVAGAPGKVIRRRLAFAPKTSIAAANEKDWPYFYSGFAVRKSRQGNPADGLAARSEFSVCLASGPATRTVHLEISPATDGEYVIRHSGSDARVRPGGGTVSFPAFARDTRGIYDFRVLQPDGIAPTNPVGLRIDGAYLE